MIRTQFGAGVGSPDVQCIEPRSITSGCNGNSQSLIDANRETQT
jgi:hypothetical protein